MKKLVVLTSFFFIIFSHSNIFCQHIGVLLVGMPNTDIPYTVTLTDGTSQYSASSNSRLIFVSVKDINKKYSVLSVDGGIARFVNAKDKATIINSNYKFTPPPVLKIDYIDNRKMCCCCNEYYVQFNLKDKKKLEVQEKIYYSVEMLAKYHKENGIGIYGFITGEEQIQLDLNKVQDELLRIYPDYGLEIGFGGTMWYNLVSSGFGMKLCSTERKVDLYENIGNHCSLKCKNICGSCK